MYSHDRATLQQVRENIRIPTTIEEEELGEFITTIFNPDRHVLAKANGEHKYKLIRRGDSAEIYIAPRSNDLIFVVPKDQYLSLWFQKYADIALLHNKGMHIHILNLIELASSVGKPTSFSRLARMGNQQISKLTVEEFLKNPKNPIEIIKFQILAICAILEDQIPGISFSKFDLSNFVLFEIPSNLPKFFQYQFCFDGVIYNFNIPNIGYIVKLIDFSTAVTPCMIKADKSGHKPLRNWLPWTDRATNLLQATIYLFAKYKVL